MSAERGARSAGSRNGKDELLMFKDVVALVGTEWFARKLKNNGILKRVDAPGRPRYYRSQVEEILKADGRFAVAGNQQ